MRGKDQATLLEAFAQVKRALPHARLVIAGAAADLAPDGLPGDYRAYLDRRAAELGIANSVVFPGFLPHGTMPKLYAAFDIFAHAALEEPFGLVVVEAMAQLVPVVAFNTGGVPEIIRDGIDGELVPAGDPTKMALRIVELASNAPRARQLALAGRERVETAFSPRGQATTMAAVYREVVRRRSGRPI
jgi:glycosyltransferase involved in cell wall biosynthesis